MINIQDSKTKAGLPNVTVAVFDSDANLLTRLYTNQYGELDLIYFQTNFLSSFVGIDYDGYASATFSVNYLLGSPTIYLQKLSVYVPPVTPPVTTSDKIAQSEKENKAIALLANLKTIGIIGAGALGLYLITKKKKRVTGFKDLAPGAQSAIILGGVGFAAYYLLFKNKTGSGGLPNQALSALQQLAAQGVYPSFSAAQAEGYAATLRTAFDDCGTDNSAVTSVMNAIQNQADILLLVSTYGTRGYKGCFDGDYFSNHEYNLSEAITSELSASDIDTINNQFSAKGIDFKF